MRMRSKPIALAVVFLMAGLLSGALAFYLQLAPTEPLDTAAPSTPTPKPEAPQQVARAAVATIPEIARDLTNQKPETRPLPAFDIMRIAPPGGVSVLAGRGKPGTFVAITENGRTVGVAEVDSNGEWTLVTEHGFAPGEPALAVSETTRPAAKVAAAPAVTDAGPVRAPQTEKAAEPPVPPRVAAVENTLLKNLENAVAAARDEAATATQPVAPAGVSSASTETVAPQSPVAVASAVTTAVTEPRVSQPAAAERQPLTSYPVPITFVFREATPTEAGRKAAALLLEYVRLKGYASLQLSGHADERGSEQFNMQLSKARLDIVAEVLRTGGFKGELILTPKGQAEPYAGVDRSKFTTEELYQLDRRVELRTAR